VAKQEKSITKILKPLSRGRITIPLEFRQKLKIGEETLLYLALKGNKIYITPFTLNNKSEKDIRNYTNKEIAEFLDEDKIDQQTAKVLRELLVQGNL
jgi:bifunctional DNA-binding transcriptional regulator/antitoxin component of YhaV-PrlF toxin-antitoxin module